MKNDPLEERIEKLLDAYGLEELITDMGLTQTDVIQALLDVGYKLPDIEEPL